MGGTVEAFDAAKKKAVIADIAKVLKPPCGSTYMSTQPSQQVMACIVMACIVMAYIVKALATGIPNH